MEHVETFAQQWGALQKYCICMHNVVDIWKKFLLNSFQSEYFSRKYLQTFLDHIDVSVSALRDKYVYDMLNVLHITANASGFPQMYDIRLLATQHKRLIEGKEKVGDVNGMKKAYIGHLFSEKKINYSFLERIAKMQLQNKLLSHVPLTPFKIIDISALDSINGTDAYLCIWERFGYKNIPSLYAMVFEYHGKSMDEYMIKELSIVLREETNYMPKLERLGNRIDYAFAFVRPKWIGRIVCGPVFISNVTQDEHLLQQTIDALYDGRQYIAASRIIFEYIISAEEKLMGALFDPHGNRHEVLQEWSVRSTEQDCYIRGVSGIEKFLFAPHHVVQMLDEDFRKEIGHKIVGGL
jgi:hypothetical protein